MDEHDRPSQTVVASVHALLTVLGTDTPAKVRLIVIDGVGGAGKSALGAQLAAAFDGAVHVDLDDFLIKKQDKFFDALRLDDLKRSLLAGGRLVIVSGICVLRVLETFELCPDVVIYVKRMRKWGWADEDEIDGDELERTAAKAGVAIEAWPLQVEVRNYHRKYRPHDRAGIVLERLEDC
jgi:hypothetical protein